MDATPCRMWRRQSRSALAPSTATSYPLPSYLPNQWVGSAGRPLPSCPFAPAGCGTHSAISSCAVCACVARLRPARLPQAGWAAAAAPPLSHVAGSASRVVLDRLNVRARRHARHTRCTHMGSSTRIAQWDSCHGTAGASWLAPWPTGDGLRRMWNVTCDMCCCVGAPLITVAVYPAAVAAAVRAGTMQLHRSVTCRWAHGSVCRRLTASLALHQES